MTTFIPDVWSKALFISLNRTLTHENNRRGHAVYKPHTPEYLAARAEAVQEWEALTARLLEAGYLTEGDCYECGAPTANTSIDTREWVYDETEQEHQARTAHLNTEGTYTFLLRH